MFMPAARCFHAVPSAPTPGYRGDIDGLRAVAVLAVVAFHAGLPGASGGFAGVDVFFVISGYLIGGIVFREVAEKRFSFAGFYVRRARRIVPALVATAALTLALGLLLLGPGECTRLAISIAAALLGVSNLWFLHTTDYFLQDARLQPFLMTWSLAVEEQFYVLLPILLLLVHRFGGRPLRWILGIFAVSLSLSVAMTALRPVEAFYLLPTRAWELGLGVAVAVAQAQGFVLAPRVQRVMAPMAAAALLGSIGLLDESVRFPGYAALLPTVASAVLISTPTSAINRRLLASRPAIAIGLVSYSWYLLHWPLLALLRICAAAAVPMWLTAAVALGSIVPACAMWSWVERPFRRPSVGQTPVGTLRWYGATILACLAALGGIAASGGMPARVGPAGARVEAMLAASRGGPCLAGYGVAAPNLAAACAPAGVRPVVALLGDSHAAALGDALRARGRDQGFDVLQLTAASCPPLLGATLTMRRHPGAAQACAKFNEAAITHVADDPRVSLVVVTGFWQSTFGTAALAAGERVIDADPRFAGRSGTAEMAVALHRTLKRLRTAGKAVLLLGDVPWLRFDPALHAWSALLPARAALERRITPGLAANGRVSLFFVEPLNDKGGQIVTAAAARVPGVTLVELRRILCDTERCRTGAGELPFFIDPQHLSRAGAAFVLDDPALAKSIAAVSPRSPASAHGNVVLQPLFELLRLSENRKRRRQSGS